MSELTEQTNTSVHCEFGNHSEHDPVLIDDNGNCPGTPLTAEPHPKDDIDPLEAEADLEAAEAADAMARLRRYHVYGPIVEAPDEEDLAAISRWRSRLEATNNQQEA